MTAHVYTSRDTLPEGLLKGDFFHSFGLFCLYKDTPRLRPLMVTAEDDDGRVMAQMLAIVRYRTSWLPPYFYAHCRVYGEGEYAEAQCDKTKTFELMFSTLKDYLGRRVLYIEVSNLSQKMFAYSEFRQHDFFPVRWMSIHNSLHSRTPEERISPRMLLRIQKQYERGVVTEEVATDDDFRQFMHLMRNHNRLKPKRYIPNERFFRQLKDCGDARLWLTRYRNHVIGCSVVAFSGRQAYLWYAAYRRKSFAWLHPDEMTIWHALKSAHADGYDHLFFLDVGLPFSKNHFREFILRFGGKPTSTYRWFHCTIGWINRLFSWFYRD